MQGLTMHASRRCQQRGITNRRLREFLANADVSAPAGHGCYAIRLSRSAAREIKNGDTLLTLEGIFSAEGPMKTIKHRYRRRTGWRFPSGCRRHRSPHCRARK